MNKAKIKSNLVSFGLAFLVALVICSTVVVVHFLTPHSSASAEVSFLVVNTLYDCVSGVEGDTSFLYGDFYTDLAHSFTITAYCQLVYDGNTYSFSQLSLEYDSDEIDHIYYYYYILYFGDSFYLSLTVADQFATTTADYSWIDARHGVQLRSNELQFKLTSDWYDLVTDEGTMAYNMLIKTLDEADVPTPWSSVLPPNTNADDVTTTLTSQTDYYIVESYFTDSNSEGDYDIGAGISLDNSSAGFSFTFFYNGIGYSGNTVSVYYREDTSVAKALTIVTFVGTSQSNNTMTIKCWRYETLISNVYTTYNYWTNAVDDSVKLADYSIRVVFLSPPSANTVADWFAYSTLSSGLTDTLPSFAPTFGNSVAVNFVTWYSKAFSDSTITQLDLVGYEVTNASDYLVNATCRVNVKLITNDSITPSDTLTADDYLHIDNVLLYPINGKYYLILSCTQAIKSIRVNFVGQSDFATISIGLQLSAYIANGTTIEALKNFSYNEGRAFGYNQGYNAGATEKNNLMSLIWYTFELPFKIMFGTYDNDENSSTYQQYVGGLFNFEFLGLDIRAFVLSVLSVCIIIAIVKLILGNRGGSNG